MPTFSPRRIRLWQRVRDSGVLSLAALIGLTLGGTALWRQVQDQELTASLKTLVQPGDIRMVSSVTCVFCERARTWLQARQIPFEECFIEREADCAERYRQLGARGTPTLQVRGAVQLGFDARLVLKVLAPPPGS